MPTSIRVALVAAPLLFAAGFACGLAWRGRAIRPPESVPPAAASSAVATPPDPASTASAPEHRRPQDPFDDAAPNAAAIAHAPRKLAQASAVARHYAVLDALYRQGGPGNVLQGVSAFADQLREVGAADELMTLVRAEQNTFLLREVLQDLALELDLTRPLGGSAEAEAQVTQALWSEFEGCVDADRADALLGFFCAHPRLRSQRAGEFVVLAQLDPRARIRQRAMSSMDGSAHRDDVRGVLELAALSDPLPKLRATAVYALRHADQPDARATIAKAMDDADPEVRATAFSVAALPTEAAERGRFGERLRSEFASYKGPQERTQVLDRLIELEPERTSELLAQRLAQNPRSAAERDYFLTLKALLDAGVRRLDELDQATRSLKLRYRYGN